MQQTAVDGVSLADGKMTSEQGVAFYFQADTGMNSKTSSQVTTHQEFVSLLMSPKQRDAEMST